MRSLNLIGNWFVRWLLLSPLHGLLSKHVMLVTVTGRKSGIPYTTPVEYARDGNTIYATSTTERTWWRNLHGGQPVQVRIAARNFDGTGDASTDPASVEKAVRCLYPNMNDAQRARFQQGRVAIIIRLSTN
ncbi:MAG: nitroreductase family deazaflavin-dependent oxidoreductase [Anaerolineae bacterium]|nr:nitroreductase family deazaflavin-dependent oxidoreductase [Anaerolineae bacterium]